MTELLNKFEKSKESLPDEVNDTILFLGNTVHLSKPNYNQILRHWLGQIFMVITFALILILLKKSPFELLLEQLKY